MDLRGLFEPYRVGDSQAYVIDAKRAAHLLGDGMLVEIPRPACATRMLYCPSTGGVAYVKPPRVPAGDC